MNSPEKVVDQVLGTSVTVIKDFLMECVNLPDPLATIVPIANTPYANFSDDSPHFDRWLRKWQRLFTFQTKGEDGEWRTMELPREQLKLFAPVVRLALRRIWVEQDARQRDWYFYRLRDAYHHMVVRAENPYIVDATDGQAMARLEQTSLARRDNMQQKARLFREWMGADLFEDVPRICPFEAALYWLQTNQRLMLRCGGPMCPAPYFFRTEKGQKFCSPECADPARRDAKLRWWNESPNSPKNRGKMKSAKKKSLR
jgi:hypothetical protein